MAIGATPMVTDTFRFYIYTRKSVRDHENQADAAGLGVVLPPPSSHITMITDEGNGEGRGQRDGGTS